MFMNLNSKVPHGSLRALCNNTSIIHPDVLSADLVSGSQQPTLTEPGSLIRSQLLLEEQRQEFVRWTYSWFNCCREMSF